MMKRLLPVCIIACLLILGGCDQEKKLFKKLSLPASGISFENKVTPTEDFNIIDYLYFYNGGGVASGDINGDGLPDLFFSGNQVKNKLYLNKGNLKFEDITEQAGVGGNSSWNTGAVMGDVNGDGLLDIYVCAVVGLKNLKGHNELYINNGDNTFSEKSEAYGLNFESYGSSAAFLDYDMDGDLDIYLLNHAIHTSESFGRATLRNTRNYETGDKLLRNEGDKFTDVSENAHIFGGVSGYGLGVAVSDFNQDGYPDIYISNDFHEDDYYYVNNQDGTFTEQGKESFTFFSRFSMGNDAADVNHDGYTDLITLDMLAEDEVTLKRSEGDENINILNLRTRQYGYHYQFARNMFHINQQNGTFAETGLMSKIAATDWSWSALFSDFNQDGNQDLFISNGIPYRPNDLDYIKYVSGEQIVNTIGTTKLIDKKALAMMPEGKAQNYLFKGYGNFTFEDKSSSWLPAEKTCSGATALADLDNDGDLDIVINNINDAPGIYINQTNESAHYLKIKFDYTPSNKWGIGTRVYAYDSGILQYKELYTVRGYQASSEPLIHFGFGAANTVDSVKVVWPDRSFQTLKSVETNQTLVVSPAGNKGIFSVTEKGRGTSKLLFELINSKETGLDFVHTEDVYTDFDRLKLLPYQQSDRGPATAIGDINNDGLSDIYFGGSKRIPGQFFIQSDLGFKRLIIPEILNDSVKESVDAVMEDFNGDERTDLFIGTGGADFYNKAAPLLDSYYKSGKERSFDFSEISDYYENASCLKAFDFDKDGDKDLFVGNESVSNNFGQVPKSYLLLNDKGAFTPIQKEIFENLGMVTDAAWDDYNKDGQMDLIVVGEWMQPVFFKNEQGLFERDKVVDGQLSGLWQSISPFDIDGDNDQDYIVGNWGLNSKFKASQTFPMKMYYGDFDANGISETILSIEKNGKYYPLDGMDLLASQMPSLKKKYLSYQSFAGQTTDQVFSSQALDKAVQYEIQELATGYLKNENGKFKFIPLPTDLQVSPIMAQLKCDFDSDGKDEVLLGGNYFGVQPFHGRYGSFVGALIKDAKTITMGNALGLNFFNKSVRQLNIISVKGDRYLLVTINNDKAQLYKLLNLK